MSVVDYRRSWADAKVKTHAIVNPYRQYEGCFTLTIQVLSEKKGVKNAEVEIIAEGKPKKKKTDENGYANVVIDIPQGTEKARIQIKVIGTGLIRIKELWR